MRYFSDPLRPRTTRGPPQNAHRDSGGPGWWPAGGAPGSKGARPSPVPPGLGRLDVLRLQHVPAVFLLTDAQNATCAEPAELTGWPVAQVGNPLRYMCITHLDRRDYLFLLLIGFGIFSAGTVAAWLTGMCAVLYQSARRKSSDEEAEDEHGQRSDVSGRIFRSRVDSAQDGFPQLI